MKANDQTRECHRCGALTSSASRFGLCSVCLSTAESDTERGSSPTAPLDCDDGLELEGSTIGSYKVLRRIGHGGFGDVYLADQLHPVRRKVALKAMKPGMDSREMIARFEVERQALALMDHPNIAGILDAGTLSGGRPYFVMDYVDGVPITAFCDRNRLTIGKRIALFQDVCAAVRHAHQRGIIHRDLKPSNILVTMREGGGLAKVIDFGIAKAIGNPLTDKTLVTKNGQMVGTPEYMSPEQAETSGMGIDTRSDIYSLGVILYELLAGVPPFDGKRLRSEGFREMLRIIGEEDACRPSTRFEALGEKREAVAKARSTDTGKLGRRLRNELDWITIKALQKDPGRRYATVDALSEDLARYLEGQPVSAGPPSAVYRIRKFALRHRGALAAAVATLAALVIGLVLTHAQANRAIRAEGALEEKVGELEKTRHLLRVALAIEDERLDGLDPLDNPELELPVGFQEIAMVNSEDRMYLAHAIDDPVMVMAPESGDDPEKRFAAAKVGSVVGSVQVVSADGTSSEALAGMILGDVLTIRTGNRSRVEIQFSDQSVVRLGSNTLFNLQGDAKGGSLEKGTVLLREKGKTRIRTAAVTGTITG